MSFIAKLSSPAALCCTLLAPHSNKVDFNSAIFGTAVGTERISWPRPAGVARVGGCNICMRVQMQNLITELRLAVEGPSKHVRNRASTDLEVKLLEASMVKPASATPTGSYFLSNIDLTLAHVNVEFVGVFTAEHANRRDDPVKVMKEALERVLVHYYPLAGRLALNGPDDGRSFVACNGQGVYFVEADANINIAGLGNLDLPDPASLSCLVYRFPAPDNPPLLTVQVTRFKCGGYVLGLAFSHCMCDGVGAVSFVNSWAETARGVQLSLPPVLDRTFLKARNPVQVNYNHIEYTEVEDLRFSSEQAVTHTHSSETVLRSFHFTQSSLAALRRKALEDGVLSRCTVYEALSGLLWKVHTSAMPWKPEQKVKIYVGCDGRFAKGAGIPRAYMGNGVVPTAAIARAGEVEGNPLWYAVKQVQDAKKRVTGDYMRSQVDFLECEGVRPHPYNAATVAVPSWARLSSFTVDFGWGKPSKVLPVGLMLPSLMPVLACGEDGKAMNVLVCHSPDVMDKIDQLLHPYLLLE